MNKEKILRDLEFVNGGITTLKAIFETNTEKHHPYYNLCDEWQDVICNVIDMIEEDYDKCREPLKNLPR